MAVKPADIDAYIAALPEAHRDVARQIRAAIHAAASGLTETIRYGMPAFQWEGATVIYFAIWKTHIGLYPIYRGDEAYEHALAPYRSRTDTVNLPFGAALPDDLIAQIVRMQISLGSGR